MRGVWSVWYAYERGAHGRKAVYGVNEPRFIAISLQRLPCSGMHRATEPELASQPAAECRHCSHRSLPHLKSLHTQVPAHTSPCTKPASSPPSKRQNKLLSCMCVHATHCPPLGQRWLSSAAAGNSASTSVICLHVVLTGGHRGGTGESRVAERRSFWSAWC